MDSLTPRQKLFLVEYLRSSNATQSAIKAGYSEKSAYSQGQRLLKHVAIQKYLLERKAELIQELQSQFVSDARKARNVLYEIMSDPNASNRDRITAAKDLLDRAGFSPVQKSEISGADGGTIQIVFKDPSGS